MNTQCIEKICKNVDFLKSKDQNISIDLTFRTPNDHLVLGY